MKLSLLIFDFLGNIFLTLQLITRAGAIGEKYDTTESRVTQYTRHGVSVQSKLRGPDIISGQFGVRKSKGRIGKGLGADT